MQTYKTSEGDVLDAIILAQYGRFAPDMLVTVMEANRGLAAYGPLLPAGLTITLPDIQTSATTKKVLRLWS